MDTQKAWIRPAAIAMGLGTLILMVVTAWPSQSPEEKIHRVASMMWSTPSPGELDLCGWFGRFQAAEALAKQAVTAQREAQQEVDEVLLWTGERMFHASLMLARDHKSMRCGLEPESRVIRQVDDAQVRFRRTHGVPDAGPIADFREPWLKAAQRELVGYRLRLTTVGPLFGEAYDRLFAEMSGSLSHFGFSRQDLEKP